MPSHNLKNAIVALARVHTRPIEGEQHSNLTWTVNACHRIIGAVSELEDRVNQIQDRLGGGHPPTADATGPSEHHLFGERDARIWALEFLRLFEVELVRRVDHQIRRDDEALELLQSWFANAIESGINIGRAQYSDIEAHINEREERILQLERKEQETRMRYERLISVITQSMQEGEST